MKNIVLHPSMGRAILHYLRMFCPIEPSVGPHAMPVDEYIAGQSVASAISALYGDGSMQVYNDVDLFRMNSFFRSQASGGLVLRPDIDDLVLKNDGYGHFEFKQENVYSITQVRREGMLNLVDCTQGSAMPDSLLPDHRMRLFLSSFDLNCTQVGVRLSDGALVWTPAFERFVRTKEMLVENNKTPLHTAIRWFKKKAELDGVFGHDERAMQLLSASSEWIQMAHDGDVMDYFRLSREDRRSRRYLGALASKMAFGAGYLDKMAPVEKEVLAYFSLESCDFDGVRLFHMKPRASSGLDRDVMKRLPLQMVTSYARAVQGFWRRHQSRHIRDVLESAQETNAQFYERTVLTRHADMVSSPAAQKEAHKVSNIITDHRGMSHLASCGLDYPVLRDLVAAIESHKQDEQSYIYGTLDHPEAAKQLLNAISQSEPGQSMGSILQAVMQDRKARIAVLTQQATYLIGEPLGRLMIQGRPVHELRTDRALHIEGRRMHHCVAGYLERVLRGDCAIFSLGAHKPQDALTLEVVPLSRKRLGVTFLDAYQLSGLCNRQATEQEQQSAQLLVDALNLSRVTRGLVQPGLALSILSTHPLLPRLVRSLTPRSYRYGNRRQRLWQTVKMKLRSFRRNSREDHFNPDFIPF